MKIWLLLFVLSMLHSASLSASPRSGPIKISVNNFGDMVVHKKACAFDSGENNEEPGFRVSLFGNMYSFRERFYPLAVMQESHLELSMMFKSDSQVVAFVSTHRNKSGEVTFDKLSKFSHDLEDNRSIFAPILFDEGINTVYQVNESYKMIYVESVDLDGHTVSKIFGKLSGVKGGYFKILFKPAVGCDFLLRVD